MTTATFPAEIKTAEDAVKLAQEIERRATCFPITARTREVGGR